LVNICFSNSQEGLAHCRPTAELWGDEVLVPVVGLGIGTGTARVRDARSGREVKVRCRTVRLVAGQVCVVARSHGVEDRPHRVTLPGGVPAWVRVVTPGLGRAA
jgi:hypothetical protein